MDIWNKKVFGNGLPAKDISIRYKQAESNQVNFFPPWKVKKQPIFPPVKTPKSGGRLKSQSKSNREYLPRRDFISIETNLQSGMDKLRASAFPIHEKSMSRDQFLENSSIFDMQEKSQFSQNYQDVLDQFEERKYLKLSLPAITAFTRSVEREKDGAEIFSHGNPKPRDKRKEKIVMMMPISNAYCKIIKKYKEGVEFEVQVKENNPKIETQSESSHLKTESAQCENAELVSQFNQTVIFESTESEPTPEPPTPEPPTPEPPTPEPPTPEPVEESEEEEVQIPNLEILSYMRESLPQSTTSKKSSHTPTGESIEDPNDIEERRLLQQELLTVSGIMDKSMITNQVLDSLDVKDLLKSADFHAAQNINQIQYQKEPSQKDKISEMSEIISVEDLLEAPIEPTPRESYKVFPTPNSEDKAVQVQQEGNIYQTHDEIADVISPPRPQEETLQQSSRESFSEMPSQRQSYKIIENPVITRNPMTNSIDMRAVTNFHINSPPMWKSQNLQDIDRQSYSEITEDEPIPYNLEETSEKSSSPISLAALLQFIEGRHPQVGLWESCTINGFYQRLFLGVNCKMKGKREARVEKPLDVYVSDSSSEDEALTNGSKNLGVEGVLYLQIMKTLAVMFFILVILNLPVYYLLQESEFFSLSGLTYELQIEANADLLLACPSENHYLISLDDFGMKNNRRLLENSTIESNQTLGAQINNKTQQLNETSLSSNETIQQLNQTDSNSSQNTTLNTTQQIDMNSQEVTNATTNTASSPTEQQNSTQTLQTNSTAVPKNESSDSMATQNNSTQNTTEVNLIGGNETVSNSSAINNTSSNNQTTNPESNSTLNITNSFVCLARIQANFDEFNSTQFERGVAQGLNASVQVLKVQNGSVIVTYRVYGDGAVRQKHVDMVLKGQVFTNLIDFGIQGEKPLMKDGIIKGVCKQPNWKQNFDDCKGKSQCQMEQMEDPDCQERMAMKATCRQNYLEVPMIGAQSRETVAIALVCFEFIGICLMTYLFIQLGSINEEFCQLIDKNQLKVKDFALQLQNIKCDKHTQDLVVLKMKLWLQYTKLMQPFKNHSNDYQIIDITFNQHPKQEQIDKMEKTRLKIERLSKNFSKNQDKIEDLQEILHKQKLKYAEKQVAIRRDVQYAYITFKNKITSNIKESMHCERAPEPDHIIWNQGLSIPVSVLAVLIIAVQVTSIALLESVYLAAASLVVANGLIQYLFQFNGGCHTTEEKNLRSMVYIFLMEFLNCGVLVLIFKFKWPIEMKNVESLLLIAMGCLCLTANLFDLIRYMFTQVIRQIDRGFSFNLKQNLDDDFDDQPNSRMQSQEDLNNLYLGPEFDSFKKLSRALSFIYTCLLYSTWMPSMYAVCLIFIVATYPTNRFLLSSFYQRSEARVFAQLTLHLFRFAIVTKIIAGYFFYQSGVFLGKDSQLPQNLRIVQEKVPVVSVHQKVYLAAILCMIVYIGLGKFLKKSMLGCWSLLQNCMETVKIKVTTSCLYIFITTNMRAISFKLKKCFKKQTAVSQQIPAQSVEQPLVVISDETCSVEEARRTSTSIIKMMQSQIADEMKKINKKLSRNFLQEIQVDSLNMLYRRSLIDYKEFKRFFKQPLNLNIFHTNNRQRADLLTILYESNLTESDFNQYDDLLRQRIESIQRVIDSHFILVQPAILAVKKARRDRLLAEVHAHDKKVVKAIRRKIKRDFINDPELMFHSYDFDKKMLMLQRHQQELKSRKVCRIRGSQKQSYFIFEGQPIYLEVENQKLNDSESPDSELE